jgi:hypothetical protein
MKRTTLGGAVLAAVLLFGACSDGDPKDAADDKDSTDTTDDTESTDTSEDGTDQPSINPDAPEAGSQFCEDAAELVMSQASDAEAMAFAESLDPPDDIAEEWTAMISAAKAVNEADASGDPEAAAKATEAYNAITEDITKVITYFQEQCGIDAGTG